MATKRAFKQAFVSSTFKDLAQHRRHVIERLRASGIHVDPMEEWTAAPTAPARLAEARVMDCDLCVLLVARRRGHIPEGKDRSITQMEWQKAVNLGIDVLPFFLEEDADWDSEFDERASDPGLAAWKSELTEKHTVDSFGRDPESVAVLPAIIRWLRDRPGRGSRRVAALNWVQSTTAHVLDAVDHGHDFGNRLDWAKEMEKLGDTYRDVIPDLYTPIQKIAWRIRDHSFDHSQKDSETYCCNELVKDLRALQFEVLKVVQHSLARQEVEDLAVEILSDLELQDLGVRSFAVVPPERPRDPEVLERYEKTLREAQQNREEERERHLERWNEGIEWHESYAVAAKDPSPSV